MQPTEYLVKIDTVALGERLGRGVPLVGRRILAIYLQSMGFRRVGMMWQGTSSALSQLHANEIELICPDQSGPLC